MRETVHSAQAQVDLHEIWLHIAKHDALAADDYLDGLARLTFIAAQHPRSGRREPTIANVLDKEADLIRSLRYRNHRVYYYLRSDSEIYVLGYIHGKRCRDISLLIDFGEAYAFCSEHDALLLEPAHQAELETLIKKLLQRLTGKAPSWDHVTTVVPYEVHAS